MQAPEIINKYWNENHADQTALQESDVKQLRSTLGTSGEFRSNAAYDDETFEQFLAKLQKNADGLYDKEPLRVLMKNTLKRLEGSDGDWEEWNYGRYPYDKERYYY